MSKKDEYQEYVEEFMDDTEPIYNMERCSRWGFQKDSITCLVKVFR